MKRIILIAASLIALLVTLVGVASLTEPIPEAKSSAQTLTRANQLYENGRFGDAVRLYTQLIDEGVSSSVVYYNLGNARMQTDDYTSAVAAYEQAQTLAPRDEAIAKNLRLAREQMPQGADQPHFLSAVLTHFSLDELAVGAVTLWAVLLLGIVVLRQHVPTALKQLVKPAMVLIGTFLVAAMFLVTGKLYANTLKVVLNPAPASAVQQVDNLPDTPLP